MTEMHFFRHLPSTEEFLDLLKMPELQSRWDKRNRLLTWVMLLAIVAVAACWGLIELGLIPKRPGAWVALGSLSVVMIAWIVAVVVDVLRTVPSLRDPAKEMATQFDLECRIENEILPKLRLLPVEVLAERHRRLEWQLARWEKWLDVARLMGMLGPLVIFVGNGLLGRSVWSHMGMTLELFVSAALTGMLIGAISLRAGIRRLQRVSYVLRRASERQVLPPELRNRPRKRR